MSELPSVGDFARVVGECPCGGTHDCIGDVVLVTHLTDENWVAECPICKRNFHGRLAHSPADLPGECYPHVWLRKIQPARALLEEIEREAVPA